MGWRDKVEGFPELWAVWVLRDIRESKLAPRLTGYRPVRTREVEAEGTETSHAQIDDGIESVFPPGPSLLQKFSAGARRAGIMSPPHDRRLTGTGLCPEALGIGTF